MASKNEELSLDQPNICSKSLQLTSSPSHRLALIAAGIIIIAALGAYHNSFSGPFVFDGKYSIVQNPHIRQLWPIWHVFRAQPGATLAGRPIVSLSFALNYQISGLEVWSYHATNLAIHILAALTLFGIIRQTLFGEKLRTRFGQVSFPLALICALIWLLHPLQTGSVTYMVQRAESLMGLFYLLALYCAIRGFSADQSKGWYILAILACAFGMGAKEVMVTAPLMVLVYDRIFISRSFKEALNQRRGLYVGLAATWIICVGLAITAPRGDSAGFGMADVSWLEYALTQCLVIVSFYLKLVFWPYPLVFDYGLPIVKSINYVLPQASLLALLLIGTLLVLRLRPAWGFLGVWFFLILAPSSSILPVLTEVAAEHRMYLSLAAIVVLLVLGAYVLGTFLLARLAIPDKQRTKIGQVLGYILAGIVVVALGLLTFNRNNDYATDASIWQTAVNQRPNNFRARNNLGMALKDEGKFDQALIHFTKTIELHPEYATAYNNRAKVYAAKRNHNQAIRDYTKAIELKPRRYLGVYGSRANSYLAMGDFTRAMRDFNKDVELNPNRALPYDNRGFAYLNAGELDLAIRDFSKSIELNPKYPKTYYNRANAYSNKGQHDLAVRDLETVVQLALASGNKKLAMEIQTQLNTYKANRPYP